MSTHHVCTAIASSFIVALGTSSTCATTISFQDDVSPSGAYDTPVTYIRSDSGLASTPQDGDPEDEILVGFIGGNSNPANDGELRGLLEFDLSAISAAAGGNPVTIDDVQLVLYQYGGGTFGSPPSNELTVFANSYAFDFVEGNADWNDPDGDGNDGTGDTTAGGTVGTTLASLVFADASAVNGFSTFDNLSGDDTALKNAVATGLGAAEPIRFILTSTPTDADPASDNIFLRFYDETFATVAQRPELIVTFTVVTAPEPSTFALAVFGIVGFCATLRRRRR